MGLILHVPTLEELWFRQRMLEDPETMAYNRAWGGTIPWPREAWQPWFEHWIERPEQRRFYRYLQDGETGAFVGEIAYHWDERAEMCLADVIVFATYRGRGYGRAGLRLLCQAARDAGFEALYDDIAADNPAIGLFLSEGFIEVSETEMLRLLKKDLSNMQATYSIRRSYSVE